MPQQAMQLIQDEGQSGEKRTREGRHWNHCDSEPWEGMLRKKI